MSDQLKKITEARDAGAFRSLFATFYPKVKVMLMRQGADRETAEEIAQETMLAVWNKSYQFTNERGSISAWIYAIARNLRIDRLRKQVVWQRFYAEFEVLERLQSPFEEMRSWEFERDDIEKALAGLPPEQLQILKLSIVEGLPQSEIAVKLSLPLGTVKSRMRLAFEKLRGAREREA